MVDVVSRRVSYKLTDFKGIDDVGGFKLSQLLSAALTKMMKVGDRRQPLAASEARPIWRLIGQFQVETEFVFGVLIQYVPGTDAVLVVDDATADALTMEQMAAPLTDDGKRRDVPEGLLFFGALDNHLVVMQSLAMRSPHLEQHLQWLLHHGKVLPGTATLRLLDQPPPQVVKKVESSPVKSVSIGGDLTSASLMLPPVEVEPAAGSPPGPLPKDKVVKTTQTGEASASGGRTKLDALKELISPTAAASLGLDSLTESSNLQYTIEITYNRKTTEEGQTVLNRLSAALRNTDDVDCKVRLADGTLLSGENLKLSGPVKINLYNGLPSPAEVYEVMRTWLLEKISDGEVKG